MLKTLIAGFKKRYPDITIELYDGEQHELMHGVHRGRFRPACFPVRS
ncbi:hypothetical protein WDV93_23180 [Pantoea ananatis]